jgi:F-type H+-transporting ATPase subunit alpha
MGFSSVLKKGNRIALRSKVNDSLITGIALVDSLLPVGRGQRQLILGDRSTGKTSIFLTCILVSLTTSAITSIDGFGSRRLFMVYVAINQNLSKISTIINKLGSL